MTVSKNGNNRHSSLYNERIALTAYPDQGRLLKPCLHPVRFRVCVGLCAMLCMLLRGSTLTLCAWLCMQVSVDYCLSDSLPCLCVWVLYMYASLTASEAVFLVSSSAGCLVVLEEPRSHCHHLRGDKNKAYK